MSSNEQTLIYSEVYGVLEMLGEEYINEIPKKMYTFIKENRDKSYNPIYDIDKPLSKQNLKRRTVAFICMLDYNYWCKTEEERTQINKILLKNEEKIKEKYSVNNIFKQDKEKEANEKEEVLKENKELIKYEEKWYTKFINFIKKILKK